MITKNSKTILAIVLLAAIGRLTIPAHSRSHLSETRNRTCVWLHVLKQCQALTKDFRRCPNMAEPGAIYSSDHQQQ